jgi:hypothetical protein
MLATIHDIVYEKGPRKMRLLSRAVTVTVLLHLLAGLATRAYADLQVNLSDVTLAPGGAGTMAISVTPPSGSNTTLSDFGLQLLITPVGTPTSLLQFSSNQVDPYASSGYVFSSVSFGANTSTPFWFPPFATNYYPDSINGGDAAYNFANPQQPVPVYVTLPGAGALLATVQFFIPGGKPGDQFQISLVSSGTYFDDANGKSINYSGSGGVITLGAAVPEPSTLTVAAVSSLAGLVYYSRRRKQTRSPALG